MILTTFSSEVCMSVESIFTYGYLYRFHGSNYLADRAELVAYNTLPAGISSDCKERPPSWRETADQYLGRAHQYVTQKNQPWARNLTDGNPFYDVGDYANVYGLEPSFVSYHREVAAVIY